MLTPIISVFITICLWELFKLFKGKELKDIIFDHFKDCNDNIDIASIAIRTVFASVVLLVVNLLTNAPKCPSNMKIIISIAGISGIIAIYTCDS